MSPPLPHTLSPPHIPHPHSTVQTPCEYQRTSAGAEQPNHSCLERGNIVNIFDSKKIFKILQTDCVDAMSHLMVPFSRKVGGQSLKNMSENLALYGKVCT